MAKAFQTGVLLCALALVGTSCGGGGDGDGTSQPADGGTFSYVISADPGNLDPHQTVLSVTNAFNTFTYDTLVAFDDDGAPVSNLAESWQADASTATFTLRDDITCDDGATLTASDVKANFDYIQDEANSSPLIGTTFPNRDFTTEADDTAGTVTVTTAQPYGFLLRAVGAVPIVCPAGIEDRSLLAQGSAGTGPFMVTEAVASDHYTLQQREGYDWGPDGASADAPGFPDTVVTRVVDNEATAANLLLTGEINAAGVTGADQERLRAQDLFEASADEVTGSLYFNHKDGHPGNDPAVRRALSLALNLNELTTVLTGGTGSRQTALAILKPRGCTGSTVEGNVPESQDVDAARRALDDAGWIAGSDGKRTKNGEPLTVRLLYKSGQDDLSAAMELIAATWTDTLGVTVDSQAMTDTGIIEATFSGDDWDVANLPPNANLPVTLAPFLSGPMPPDGSNYSAIDNPTYTSLAAEATVTEGEEGCALWNRAEAALFTEFDVLPIAQTPTVIFGNRAEFDVLGGAIVPTSITLLAS